MNSVRVAGISKRYGPVAALDDVTLGLAGGECFCLLGRNGAGKTTLLGCMTGLAVADAGAVFYDERRLEGDAVDIKARLGVLPERDPTIPELTGLEYLEFVSLIRRIPPPGRNGRIRELTETLLESDEVLHRRVAGYSHGMRVKLALCAALLGDPDFIVLDEPFSNLDPVSSARLVELLRSRRDDGAALLVSSHSLGPVARLATHIGVLDHGRLLYAGGMAEFTAGDAAALERSLLRLLGVDPDAGTASRREEPDR